MKIFYDKKDCCGCTACKNICPTHAINMRTDKEGFFYPDINEDLCIGCNLCIDVCPMKNEVMIQEHFEIPEVYAVKHVSDSVRMSSSSGGAYTAISDFVIEDKNGICYGAAFDEEFNVKHKEAINTSERNKFRGSKYVQSDLGNVFYQIKQNLISEKLVLFTGTPCQTAGLANYLKLSKVDVSNLILNDIICHGTPSPKIWKDYINFIEEKNKSKIKNYTFRFKEKGWRGYNIKVEFENNYVKVNTKDILKYVKLFNSNLILRPSCYHCKFSNLNRSADLTIGDFWGIEKSIPEFEDTKGVSLVLVNTKRGKDIFEQIKNNFIYKQSNTADCMQLNLYQPTPEPKNRIKFWEDYWSKGFKFITKNYARDKLSRRIKSLIKKLLQQLGLLTKIKQVLARL
jgi:coenzyme F420-reducing hydrogenase beta subunit